MELIDLRIWLISKGYKQDTYGHYQKQKDGKTYRYKIQNISVRYETKVHHEYDNTNSWIRIASGYFKDLKLNDKNQLCGMKY
jgi:hypothetical protein